MTAERRVQVALMLIVGGAAGAAALTHVAELAIAHGRPVWEAWSCALVLETMAVSTGLEIRRRRARGLSAGWVAGALVSSVVLSAAAQVAMAEPSVWGWTMAAVPMAGFLVLAKIAMSSADRPRKIDGPSDSGASEVGDGPPTARPPTRPVRPAARPRPAPVGEAFGPSVAELLLVGQAVAREVADEGARLTRDRLVAGLRARGHTCSTARAGELLKAVKAAA